MELEAFKGFNVSLSKEGIFIASKDGEEVFREATLATLKDKINEFDKRKVRMPVIVYSKSWGDEQSVSEGFLTSVTKDEGKYSTAYDFWVTMNSGGRAKCREKEVLKATKGNKDILAKIAVARTKSNELKKEIEKLESSLEHVEPKDVGFEEEKK